MATNPKKGNDLLIWVGNTYNATGDANFTKVAAITTTSVDYTRDSQDVTTKDDSAWSDKFLTTKSITISGSGICTDSASAFSKLMTTADADTSWTFQLRGLTTERLEGAFNVTSLKSTGEVNGAQTFDITMSSTGKIAYIA